MKKMKTYSLLTLALVAFCGSVSAQEGFTKQIEVQKEYEVVVRGAERIESDVALLDTVIVRPELTYRIRPTAHLTNFSTSALRPVTLSTARWEVPRRLYLNVGAGLPLQSEVDVYWSPVQGERNHLMLWLNHEGSEGRVTNDDQERIAALTLRNQAGVRYTALLGRNTHLTTGVKYRGTLGNAYGGVGVTGARPFVSVHDVEATANLTGDLGEKSPLGYDANLMGLYAFNNVDESVWRFNVNYGLLGLNRVKSWLPSRITLHWSGVESTCAEPYYDTSVTFVPEWGFRIGKWVPVEIMAGYDYMIYKGAKNTLDGVISSIGVSFDKYSFAMPYLTVANDVQTKCTREALWTNPYMHMLHPDSRKIFLAELGVKGELGSLTYKLSGATRWFSAYMFEVIVEGSPLLGYGKSKAQRVWYADAEISWRPVQRFSLDGRFGFRSLGKAAESTAEFSPRRWNIEGEAVWMPLRRLSLVLRGAWRSSMGVTQLGASGAQMVEMPSYFDLGVEASWRWSERVNVWLRGDNLLNEKIYHWATYRALGAGARMGVSMSF